jgi:multiple sugar transport system permease protein
MEETLHAISRKPRKSRLSRHEEHIALLFIAIPLIGFLIFTVLSFGFSFFMSFTDFNPVKETTKFVGIANYSKLFSDSSFRDACLNTLLLMGAIPVGITLGLFLAVYLKNLAHGSMFLSLIYYLPAVTSAVAINVVWRYIFNGEYGFINTAFGWNIDWIGTDYWFVKIALWIKYVWGAIGGTMILYLAGLQNIPGEYYEAASIDGASKWQQFIHITIPLVDPTTFYLLVTALIGGLQSYADSLIFANGQKAARTVVYYIWQTGISNSKYGLASAASILLAVVIMIFTIIQFRHSDMFKEAS